VHDDAMDPFYSNYRIGQLILKRSALAVTQVFAGAWVLYIWLLGETNHSRKRQFDSTSICFNGSTGAYRNNTLRM
ncbi:hypothetical protein V6335_21045, partial [Serratia marcescens]|uniref:hypothetical protein n=1 Tax=Serratia marcescens TaxID=615 RepID=UPI003B86CF8A